MKDRLRVLAEAIEVQGVHGTWNYDPYMHGMYNGLIFAQWAMMSGKGDSPPFRDAPAEWLCEKGPPSNDAPQRSPR